MALVLNCWESASTSADVLTINKPTSGSGSGDEPKNAAVGDLLIIIVGNDEATSTIQWDDATYKPTGFTLINTAGDATSDAHCAAFYKVVDRNEGSSFDIPDEGANDKWGSCILISGTPMLHVAGEDVIDSTPPIAIVGVTCTESDCLAFYVAAFDGGDYGAFGIAGTGWVERAEVNSGTGQANSGGCWGTRLMSGAGATGTATVTPTNSDGMAGFQFAIQQEAEPGRGTLVDTGLITRYFIDEAASGTGPTEVVDYGPATTQNLTINYDGVMAYTEVGTGKGLSCTDIDGDAYARVQVGASGKLYDGLIGAQKVTLELVAAITQGSYSNGRAFVINDDTSDPALGLSVVDTDFQVWWEEAMVRSWTGGTARQVIHIVYDTTQAAANDRIKIYVNGTIITPDYDAAPGQNDTLSFATTSYLFMFNRGNSSWARSINGKIYYAAVYAGALGESDITNNYGVLISEDDYTAVSGEAANTLYMIIGG